MKTILILLCIMFSFTLYAQQGKKSNLKTNNYLYLSTHPVWIQCIDSPHASLAYAIYTFETFWKNKPRPMGEDGEMETLFEEREDSSGAKKAPVLSKDQQYYMQYAFDYKRFLEWKHRAARMLDKDGRVYTQEQLEEIWQIRKESQK